MLNLFAFQSSSLACVGTCNTTRAKNTVKVVYGSRSKHAILAALLAAVSAGHAFAQESTHPAFRFANVADNTKGFTQFSGFPAINNRGAVVFEATGTAFTDGIFKAQDGEVATVSSSVANGVTLFGLDPVINDAGVVVFEANLNPLTRGIFTNDGSSTKTIVNTTDQGLIGRFLGSPSINRSGTVAFSAVRNGFTSQAVFVGNGGPLSIIVDTQNSNFADFQNVAINEPGKITFVADTNDGNTGLFVTSTKRGADGNPEVVPDSTFDIIDTTNPDLIGFGDPVINAFGLVADDATRADESLEILSGDRRKVTVRTDITNNVFLNVEHPSINDEGAVAFSAIRNDGSQVILLEATGGANTIPVIQTGDQLFGSVVTGLDLGRFALNDRFQMAFQYTLQDGRTGVAVASVKGRNDGEEGKN